MDKMNQKCFNEDVNIIVKARRRPRFKAGSELSSKVNRVEISLDQDELEDASVLGINLLISSEVCESSRPGNCK